jgi:glutaminyl-tRNA synthetase
MNMNFRLAFEKLGVPLEHRRCIFRYDDTNPDAEELEYIDSLRRDVEWLGWKPERTTYSSDNFHILYEYAVELIKKGLAYVCDMTKSEMEAQRELAMRRIHARQLGKDPDVEAPIPSPDILPGRNRNTSVERNLRLFEMMKMGCFDEGSYTLRLKMDMDNPNPNMLDLVAYRIKYTPHPHAGAGWCIYPAYDYTHGICDSLEHIDYSICTLEFETRREPYYWILWALDLYRPKVYEMSRLNLQYVVLSKRRLIKLVDKKYVRGWDDPRMPTVSGLRRRGYTADIINQFCMDVGATRKMNVVEMSKLQQTARLHLADTCRRCMAALDPVRVIITNFEQAVGANDTFEVPNLPPTATTTAAAGESAAAGGGESGGSHSITITPVIYVDRSDFRLPEDDSPSYYGLVPNKPSGVGLKYQGGNLVCDQVLFEEEDTDGGGGNKVVKELVCHINVEPDRAKPKTYISWVPSNGLKCEVRVYDHLFVVPEPSDLWEDELNPHSEVVYGNAIVDPSVAEVVDAKKINKWASTVGLQFERFGYFCVDSVDTSFDPETGRGRLVFNRTVSLKEEAFKKKLTAEEEAAIEARRAQAKKGLEEKERRMRIDPVDLFRVGEEYAGKYSRYNAEGIPTHDANGAEVTKSMMKKLAKEQQKHAKQVASWKKNQK